MTATAKPLPPMTARQVAAVDTAGCDWGQHYALQIIGDHERGHRVDPAELLYARQILAYWGRPREVV